MPDLTFSEYAIARVAVSHINRFGNLYLYYSHNCGDGGTVAITPLSHAMPSANVQDGIMELPGGRVFSPWSQAGKRAPTTYPRYTQQFMFNGNTDAALMVYADFLAYAGLTRQLQFGYGRTDTANSGYNVNDHGGKYCNAMLLQVTANFDRNLITGQSPLRKTNFIVTATWQQVGEFAEV